MKEILMKNGAANTQKFEPVKSTVKKPQAVPQMKQRVNERLLPKKYVL
jgi:hypothetical protein